MTRCSPARSNKAKVKSLEHKGARLREYIWKLTAKCEEWEVSYEKQSKRIERHDEQHRETRRKASEIARWYQKLASDVEKRKTVHKHDQAKWAAERSNMHNVHSQLEVELEEIAKELSNIDVLWKSPMRK